ncbi:DNA mismatch repair protein MutS [soil metagenome]
MTRAADTPLMEQYREIKARHRDAILFFRMGDFYEMFYDDAVVAARTLGLTLTSRNNGGAAEVPLAGVPVKAANEYLRRLVERGFRVSICEQTEDPKQAKGIVRREVVETITPGAAFSDDLLEAGRDNYLCALVARGSQTGIAAVDVSTGACRLVTVPSEDAPAVLARLTPREVIVPRGDPGGVVDGLVASIDALVTEREGWEFDVKCGREELETQLAVHSLDGFGIEAQDEPAVAAAGALLRYVRELQPAGLPHLTAPRIERPGTAMPLDEMTRRNLELVESLRGGTAGTLISVLDRTLTPMGARLLRDWILAPLTSRERIEERLAAVQSLLESSAARSGARDALDGVRDLERLCGKVAAMRASPRETGALGRSLMRIPAVVAALGGATSCALLQRLLEECDSCQDLAGDICAMLADEPPLSIGDEPTIRSGVDPELDELRSLREGSRDAIAGIQTEERARTGIGSLKVGYNRVFGYFIEVTNSNRHLVPQDYQRRQTLTGAERYVTPSLKEFEARVLGATERIEARERELFDALRARIAKATRRIQTAGRCISEFDTLAALADVAERNGYVRPEMTDDFGFTITAGRHPVVEQMMPRDKFIPNDVSLDSGARVIVLTGPNMAGKSTILRQVGLAAVMAQAGCFVPARSARLGVTDRIFTRVGASDNLVRGQSTFMVEMAETSAILHGATSRSLVLLDEIGRGTSTYDGVSIAWAVTEHLHDVIGCKTIFATHYHELTQLAEELSAVRNFTVAVREIGEQVLFIYRLEPGGADRSYGIEVGRLAGLPRPVLERARSVLKVLEGEHLVHRDAAGHGRPSASVAAQLPLFAAEHPVLAKLRQVEADTLTPLQSLELLARLVDEARAS